MSFSVDELCQLLNSRSLPSAFPALRAVTINPQWMDSVEEDKADDADLADDGEGDGDPTPAAGAGSGGGDAMDQIEERDGDGREREGEGIKGEQAMELYDAEVFGDLDVGRVPGESFLPSLIRGLSRCRHLSDLHLHFLPDCFDFVALVCCALALLSSLRTLRLEGNLSSAASPPLLPPPHLTRPARLRGLPPRPSSLALSSPSTPPHSPPPLHAGCGRSAEPSVSPCLLVADGAVVLSHCPAGGITRGLERLLTREVHLCQLKYTPQLLHLHTLELALGQQGTDLADFYTSLTSSRLPVRHLHVKLYRLMGPRVRWNSRLFIALPAFLRTYAGQLLSFELLHYDRDFPTSMVERQPASTTETMTAALLSCTSLRRLSIADWWLSTALTPESPLLCWSWRLCR